MQTVLHVQAYVRANTVAGTSIWFRVAADIAPTAVLWSREAAPHHTTTWCIVGMDCCCSVMVTIGYQRLFRDSLAQLKRAPAEIVQGDVMQSRCTLENRAYLVTVVTEALLFAPQLSVSRPHVSTRFDLHPPTCLRRARHKQPGPARPPARSVAVISQARVSPFEVLFFCFKADDLLS